MVRGPDLGKDFIHVGGQIRFASDDGNAARGENCDLVDEKTMLGKNAFIARTDIGRGEEVEDFIRAVAADDACRIEAMPGANRRRARTVAAPSG